MLWSGGEVWDAQSWADSVQQQGSERVRRDVASDYYYYDDDNEPYYTENDLQFILVEPVLVDGVLRVAVALDKPGFFYTVINNGHEHDDESVFFVLGLHCINGFNLKIQSIICAIRPAVSRPTLCRNIQLLLFFFVVYSLLSQYTRWGIITECSNKNGTKFMAP